MDNSERIYGELVIEDASLWYISDEFGSKILLKAPTTSIKAIFKGCKVSFLFGKDIQLSTTYFHTGIAIYDNPSNELKIVGIDRFSYEHKALQNILQQEKTYIEFYNELDICIVKGNISFSESSRKNVLNFLGNIQNLYAGDLDESAKLSLDSFEFTLDNQRKFENTYLIEVLKIEGVFSEFLVMRNYFVGQNEGNEISIDDFNEGGIFENQIWVSFENLFQFDLYKNPEIDNKKGKRELTDILAFYDKGIFLVETKAMAVLNSTENISIERRALNVQKQIKTAIRQLIGAKKAIQKGLSIYNTKGGIINFDKSIIPHCIILVSELIPFGEWDEVVTEIKKAIVKESIFLNVFEFSDFMKYIKISSGKKELFDYHMIERTKKFMELDTIFIKARVAFDKLIAYPSVFFIFPSAHFFNFVSS